MMVHDSKGRLLSFTIDPRDQEFKDIRGVCKPGDPWKCLIATMGSIHLGCRMTVRVDHDNLEGMIGVTIGDRRYERPMTEEEVLFATKFDFGQRLRAPITISVDVNDGRWVSKPKKKGGGRDKQWRRKPGAKRNAFVRERQLNLIKQKYGPVKS